MNLARPFHVARAFLPAMRKAGTGSFISVGSVADHVGFPENAAYAASKFGLRGLHETLLAEYRGSGVRLTLVSPGPTDTEVWDQVDLDHVAEDSLRVPACCVRTMWPRRYSSWPLVRRTCSSTGFAWGR